MQKDPFTLRVALNSNASPIDRGSSSRKGNKHSESVLRAKGELYLDDGITYAHEKGELVWREFVATGTAINSKGQEVLRIVNRDLAAVQPTQAVDSVELGVIAADNKFAKSIAAVRVERIVVLGLEEKPSKVEVVSGEKTKVLGEETWEWVSGTGAQKGMVDGEQASVFTVKGKEGLEITGEWEVVVYA